MKGGRDGIHSVITACKLKDWLSETKVERDSCGNPVSITDHNGRTVRYEWGSVRE